MDLASAGRFLSEAITTAVDTNPPLAYGFILLAMLLEAIAPPIPSEMIMPLGGFLVQQGRLDLLPVILSGLVGTVLGAWFWYWIGRLINEERLERLVARHGSWLGLRPQALAASRRWFGRHGAAVIFWGRLLPAVRRTYFDTRQPGKSAAGHDFPDVLTEAEKAAVLEYLKTL